MPALVNSRVGSLPGTSDDEATTWCPLLAKKSRKAWRTSALLVDLSFTGTFSSDCVILLISALQAGWMGRLYMVVPPCTMLTTDAWLQFRAGRKFSPTALPTKPQAHIRANMRSTGIRRSEERRVG